MYLTSLNGKRTLSVAQATCFIVIDYICANPFKTVKEYAEATKVAEPTVNLIIEKFLHEVAANGGIAVSDRGRRPDWYYHLADPSVVPIRRPVKPTMQPSLPGIFDAELRQDYEQLIIRFNAMLSQSKSPAMRAKVLGEFATRVSRLGADHQDCREETKRVVARLEAKMDGMQEALQLMATALTTNTINNVAA